MKVMTQPPTKPKKPQQPPALVILWAIALAVLSNGSIAGSVVWPERVGPGWPNIQGRYIWATEESNAVICHVAKCTVGVCVDSQEPGVKCINLTALDTKVVVDLNTTVAEARAEFERVHGASGLWKVKTLVLDLSARYCMMVWQGTGRDNHTGAVLPGAYCGKAPPPNTTCEIKGDVVFDYGAINAGSVQGARKTEYINVQCSATANIILTLVGEKRITLGGGIASKLFINGIDLSSGAKITGLQGNQSFPITSILTSDATPIAGNYSGSGIVVVGYQ